jgi:exoribonuclease R
MATGFLRTKDYSCFQITTVNNDLVAEFQGNELAGKALPGDMVEWTPQGKCKLLMRTKHYPLVGILELASKTKYGMTSRGAPMYLFTPYRREYPFFVVGCSERDTSRNQLAVVEFDKWDTTELPRGNLRQLLGTCEDSEKQREAALLTFHPFKVPKHLGEIIVPPIQTYRIPTPLKTFNIDPEGCLDIDDVLSIEEIDSERSALWITISDVAEIVKPGSAIDDYASLQAFTAYENGKAKKPMLPHNLSEGSCSLLPGQERNGLSLVLEISRADHSIILNESWRLTRVTNQYQYTYENIKEKAEADGISVSLLAQFASGILGRYTDDPHEWIEACMLKYNIEAANLLQKVQRGILRKHTAPDLEKLEYYTKIGGSNLAVLANKSAIYCSATDTEPFHYGLQSKAYCHMTSPIRRYADLLNQRVVKDILLATKTDVRPDIVWLNQRQKDVKQYERDVFFLNQLEFCKNASVSAIVLEQTTAKIKLWIPEWRRTVSWKSTNTPIEMQGKTIRISYFANPNARYWKEKLVFRFEEFL